jgi:hypothetical protein
MIQILSNCVFIELMWFQIETLFLSAGNGFDF